MKSCIDTRNISIKRHCFYYTSNQNKNDNTFFQIKICENNSKVFYFENNSLKFEQKFNFGSNLIAKDISKITSLKLDVVRNIISILKGSFMKQ